MGRRERLNRLTSSGKTPHTHQKSKDKSSTTRPQKKKNTPRFGSIGKDNYLCRDVHLNFCHAMEDKLKRHFPDNAGTAGHPLTT